MKNPSSFYVYIAENEKKREEFLKRGNPDQKRKVQEAIDYLRFKETGQMPARSKVIGKVSRNDLMNQARQKGIKNFRILNKEELLKVLNPKTTTELVNKIVQEAVKRWKSGWGSRSRNIVTQKA